MPPLNKSEPEVKPACLWCNNAMYYYYEGSHDWVFTCQKCEYSKGFYIPHIGDEAQEAINRWFNWVRFIQGFTPVSSSSEAPTVKEEEVGREVTRCPECHFLLIQYICPNDLCASKAYWAMKKINRSTDCESSVIKRLEDLIHRMKYYMVHHADCVFPSSKCTCKLFKICKEIELTNGSSPSKVSGDFQPKSTSACSSEATKEEEPLNEVIEWLEGLDADIQADKIRAFKSDLAIANKNVSDAQQAQSYQASVNIELLRKLDKAIEALEKIKKECETGFNIKTYQSDFVLIHTYSSDAIKSINNKENER